MTFDADLVAAKMLEGAEWVGATYPVDIVRLAPLALPLSIVVEPRLDTDRVSSVMAAMTGREGKRVQRRRLRGCLVAHRGTGMVFLDDDDERNLRFAAAHEVAHFVAHYLMRRDTAVAKLGQKISEVLDGEREPTAAERLAGIFAGSPLGVYTDLMDREDGNPLSKREEAVAEDLVTLHRHEVDAIATALEEKGYLSGEDVDAILAVTPSRRKASKSAA